MLRAIAVLAVTLVGLTQANASLVISQYVETNSGSTPKGIELWNTSGSTIDFSVTGLEVFKGANGGSLSSDFTLGTGTLAAGAVIVVGTSDMETTAVSNGAQFFVESFTFNGDDSLSIELDGVQTDVFGTPGSDPGTAWSGGGVSTRNSNIALTEPVDLDTATFGAFTDPSVRFTTIGTSGTDLLTGFGIAPVAVTAAIPEPTAALFGSLLAGALGLTVARRPQIRR